MQTITPTAFKDNIETFTTTNEIYTISVEGKPKSILIPYFDGIEDYIEDLEMLANKEKLQQDFSESKTSGLSDLVI